MNSVIKKIIQDKRPSLSEGSYKTYTSLIKSVFVSAYPDDKEFNINKLKNVSHVMTAVHKFSVAKQRTTLASLVVITSIEEYKTYMMGMNKEASAVNATGEKNEKQAANWIDKTQIEAICLAHKKDADSLYKKGKTSPENYEEIQNYIILCLLSGCMIPPRRLLDYTSMKIKNYDPKTDNYITKGCKSMVFNVYKTAKTSGQQTVECPPELVKVLKKFITIVPPTCDYLLNDTNKHQLSTPGLNKRLLKIFHPMKISVNMLRHMYLSSKFGGEMAEKDKVAEEMGTSKNMIDNVYIKK
jgi:integrase